MLSLMLSLAAAVLGMPVLSGAAQAEEITRVTMLATMCAICHGKDGKGAQKIPKLQELEVSDFVDTMKGFRSGEEKSTVMGRIAKGFTDEEYQMLADYFAKFQ